MSLKEQITEDMKNAMRAKQAQKLGTIRLLQAAIKQKEVDERITLDDTQVIAIVDKLIKQRKDSISAYNSAGRGDLAEQESQEIAILEAYLPKRMSEQEVREAVNALIKELGASGPADMGKVMGAAKSRFAGIAEMSMVSTAVKSVLS
jgi:hypothetical protein